MPLDKKVFGDPNTTVKEKFAWLPVKTHSGKWIWNKKYIVKTKKIYGLAGESPVVYKEVYSKNEWLLKLLKNNNKLDNRITQGP